MSSLIYRFVYSGIIDSRFSLWPFWRQSRLGSLRHFINQNMPLSKMCYIQFRTLCNKKYFVSWWKGISYPKFKTVQLSCNDQSPPQTTSYNDRLYRTHVTESFGSQINKIISQLFNFPLHIRYTQIVVFSLKNNVYLCSHTVHIQIR